jgi:hypothetical protein
MSPSVAAVQRRSHTPSTGTTRLTRWIWVSRHSRVTSRLLAYLPLSGSKHQSLETSGDPEDHSSMAFTLELNPPIFDELCSS